jgi:hypothetical protein
VIFKRSQSKRDLSVRTEARRLGARLPALVAAMAASLSVSACGLTSVTGPGATLNAPALTTSSTGVDFGDVPVGSSGAQLVTLTNTSNSNVSISSVSATGGGFSASGGSAVTLTPNQSVTVSVNFDPAEEGQVQGQLSIGSNLLMEPLKIGLSGNGQNRSLQHSVNLQWQRSSSKVIGYFVYRGALPNALSKLNLSPNANTSFADKTVTGGLTYYYAVTSVNSSNVESTPSTPITVTIPNN